MYALRMGIERLAAIAEPDKRAYLADLFSKKGLDKDALLSRCHFSFNPGTAQLELAVSGGADSVAMLLLAYLYSPKIRVWHLDHSLRSTSAKEADFVRTLCKSLEISFEIKKANIPEGPNLEERAREVRRSSFISGVATGHTADDLSETLLINLMRGSGVRGLGSISISSEHPIIDLRRSETEQVCSAAEISVISDESNLDARFVRNRVRNEVIPLLNDVARRDVTPIFVRTAQLFQLVSQYLSEQSVLIDPTDAKELAASDPILAMEAVRRWLLDDKGHSISYDLAREIIAVARGDKGAVDIPGGIRVRRSKGRLSQSLISFPSNGISQ